MTTPNTTDFMLLGIAVTLGAIALYVLSLWWRARSLKADEAMLEQE